MAAAAHSAFFLHAYLLHPLAVCKHGADHTGRDDARFVGHERGTRVFLSRSTPFLLFLVHSLGPKDLTILPPPLTTPLLSIPTVPFHSFLAGHGHSIPSGNFDREQTETERLARERCNPGSTEDQSATDSGQILKRSSVPYSKKGQRSFSKALCYARFHFHPISTPSKRCERFRPLTQLHTPNAQAAATESQEGG